MINRICFIMLFLIGIYPSYAQAPADFTDPNPTSTYSNPSTFGESITTDDLKKHLTILSSDDFEGRETGTSGSEKAANYIASFFGEIGLPAIGKNKSYFQHVGFIWEAWDQIELVVNDKKYRHLWDFISFPQFNDNSNELISEEILFLGYGIEDSNYNDYKNVDVTDKVIMIYKGEPLNAKGISFVTGSTESSEWSQSVDKKLKVAKANGARAVLIIENEIQKMQRENRQQLIGPVLTLGDPDTRELLLANSAFISTNIAKAIMGKRFKKIIKARKKIQKKGKPRSVNIPCSLRLIQKKSIKTLQGKNVLGYIEGSDPKLKDELIVVTAHYDHIGRRGKDIYNGADDNGSGTSTVMEIAEAFQLAKQKGEGPRRSVLVMLVTGEEKGLLGSKYYTELPLFPLDKTVADINVDMVGRVDKKHKDNPNYIYVIGSDRLSTELHDINEKMNQEHTQLELDYTYNAKDDPNRYYYRSDHYNFAEKGIPSIFYFNGTHPDYHRISDTIEKINFNKMEKVARLIFHTSWELANRDKRIEVDVFDK